MTAPGRSDTPLAQRLGLSDGQWPLVALMRVAATLSLLPVSVVPVVAAPQQADIEGCWKVVAFSDEPQTSMCFAAGGQMLVSIYLPGEREGWDGATTYRLKGSELEIEPDPTAPFSFPASERTTCTIDVKSSDRLELSPCAPDWPATTVLRRVASLEKSQRERAATLKEMDRGLQGCWEQEGGTVKQQVADYGVYQAATLCFSEAGRVDAYTFGGDEEFGVEGLGSQGTYRLGGGKLRFEGGSGDGWLFAEPRVSCDARLIPNERLAIYNCDSRAQGRANSGAIGGPAQIFIRRSDLDESMIGGAK